MNATIVLCNNDLFQYITDYQSGYERLFLDFIASSGPIPQNKYLQFAIMQENWKVATLIYKSHIIFRVRWLCDLEIIFRRSFPCYPSPEYERLSTCEWIHNTVGNAFQFWQKYMDAAATMGDLYLVKYMHRHRTEGCTVLAMDNAAMYGHLHVVQFLHTHRSEGCTVNAMNSAAQSGYLYIVKYLHNHRTEGCTTNAMDKAPNNTKSDIANEWNIYQTGYTYRKYHHKHLGETINVKHERMKSSYITSTPFEIIKYLDEYRNEGCTQEAMDLASCYGQLEVVQYLHNHRTEGCSTKAMIEAAENGHLNIVKFLHENKHEICTTDAMDQAAIGDRLDIIKYLHEHCTVGCTTRALNYAIIYGNLSTTMFLIDHRTEGFSQWAFDAAINYGHRDVVEYIRSNGLGLLSA